MQLPNKRPHRLAAKQRLAIAACLAAICSLTTNAHGEITMTPIGTPQFEIGEWVRTSVGPHAFSDYRLNPHPILNNLLNDTHTLVTSDDHARVYLPFESTGYEQSTQLRRAVADLGTVNTDAFLIGDWQTSRAMMALYSVVPVDDAPLGRTAEGTMAPIIPSDIFPLTIKNSLQPRFGTSNTILPSLESFETVTDKDGIERDLTGMNYGHIPIVACLCGWGGGHGDEATGPFEQQLTITDKDGNGWTIVDNFEVYEWSSKVEGDIDYNGELSLKDYEILRQNVEVAPNTDRFPGRFRRLDLNNDKILDDADTTHLANLFPAPKTTGLTVGETYRQDFNSLSSGGTADSNLPNGWSVTDSTGIRRETTNLAFPASKTDTLRNDDSSPFALSTGQTGEDRALSTYNPRGNRETPAIQLLADSNTKASALKIDFSVEAWDRLRTTPGNRDAGEAAFEFSVGIDSGDRTSEVAKIIGGDFIELLSLGRITTGAQLPRPVGEFLDGNDPAHRATFTSDVLQADIPEGSRLRFQWKTTEDAVASEEWVFGIDDVRITLVAAGDTDANGEVNFLDFLALAENFGQDGGWGQGDFDGDGQVAFLDFLALAENFGQSAPAAASVPEPNASLIAAFAILGLIGFRQRR